MFSFSGYGTLGVVHSSEDNADFVVDPFRPNGPGHTRNWSADVDSRMGGQVTANFTRQLSAIVQVIAEQRSDNSYAPQVEWANIKYQVTPDFAVRAGRIVLPIFLVNDSRKIGYSNPWVRPPIEVYGLVPVTSNDGVDASWRFTVGESTDTVQMTYGNSAPKFPARPNADAGTATVKGTFGFVNTLEYGSATARVSCGRTRVTIPTLDPLFAAFRQFGPEGIAISDKYDANNKRVTFVGLGASYDPGNWFVTGEWSRVDVRSFVGRKSAWYVSGGYRFGKLTPSITYSELKAESNTSDPGLTVAVLPAFLAGPAAVLNATLNAILGSTAVQNTVSVGGRWDFFMNVALKLQYDHVSLGAGSPGTFSNLQPGFQPGGKVRVFSAAFDFVF